MRPSVPSETRARCIVSAAGAFLLHHVYQKVRSTVAGSGIGRNARLRPEQRAHQDGVLVAISTVLPSAACGKGLRAVGRAALLGNILVRFPTVLLYDSIAGW